MQGRHDFPEAKRSQQEEVQGQEEESGSLNRIRLSLLLRNISPGTLNVWYCFQNVMLIEVASGGEAFGILRCHLDVAKLEVDITLNAVLYLSLIHGDSQPGHTI